MIAVTGIGIISAAGIGKSDTLRSLTEARSDFFGTSGLSSPDRNRKYTGDVKNFSARDFIPAMKARRMSRFSQLSLASAIEAVADSGVSITDHNGRNFAVAVGTGLASTDSTDRFYEGLLAEGPEGTNPMVFPETVQNIAAAHISMHFGTRGQNITFSHSDISSELALWYACGQLKDRLTDAAIVSGADELSPAAIAGFSSFGVLSDSMMPFDRNRRGFVLGEGGAALVLERLEDARKRKAHIYCTVDALEIASQPAPTTAYDKSLLSMKQAMQAALSAAGIEAPGLVSACANSTPDLDRFEAAALQDLLGAESQSVPVTAPRSYCGYFAADGMLRIAMTALCLENGIAPAIAGLRDPLEGCVLDLVTGQQRNISASSAMVNTFSVGGSAAVTILGRAGRSD